MVNKNMFGWISALAGILISVSSSLGASFKTTYPVVFAHGMAGFDDILGYDYWGDDYGVFVGNGCSLLEVFCNVDVSGSQQAYQSSVVPLHNSEVRGSELANDVEGFMVSAGKGYVNLIGHSQGGIDSRKAAYVLRGRTIQGVAAGTNKVKALISVSSPHRGSPIAKHVLNLGAGVTSVLSTLAEFYGSVVYGAGNDAIASLKNLVYNDFSSTDGITTGSKAFNNAYGPSATQIYATKYYSFITAQQGLDLNPALYLVKEAFTTIDGNGTSVTTSGGDLTDPENDGAASNGNGNANDTDDDGLVGINSQQMGERLIRDVDSLDMDDVYIDTARGNVTDINVGTSTQLTSNVTVSLESGWDSSGNVINQDHADVIGVPPDTFDEKEFYASVLGFIQARGY
jgi:triacylglycerol lipase